MIQAFYRHLCFLLLLVLVLTQCQEENPYRYNSETGRLNKLYPSEEYFLSKQFPDSTFDFVSYEKALREVEIFISSASNRSQGDWIVEGPGNLGARANTIAVSPHDDLRMLVGFSEGGLWLTEDGGENWIPVFDDKSFLSIGDVVFDPLDPDVAYVGTGDPNISGYPFVGNGLYKSVDGGRTWRYIGLKDTRIISQIRISSQNNDIIYVSAMGIPFFKDSQRGVFKSEDGGDSWQQVLFINDSTGVCDLAIHPENHDILYASTWNRIRNNRKSLVSGPDAKIHKTTDGGNTWSVLENGLPLDASSRIGIDISQSNPDILYAAYTHETTFNLKGIFKSENAGESWTQLPMGDDVGLPPTMYAGFGWYFGKIRINPMNPDDVFILGVDIFRTKNGGQSWDFAAPPWYFYDVHADKHDLIFRGNQMYLTTDGGAYKTSIDSDQWEDIENIPTTQFYRVGYNPHKPQYYYGGAQDNGSTGGYAEIINDWERIFGGDGFQMLFHPENPDIFYVQTQNGGIFVTESGGEFFDGATDGISPGERRNWDMPIIMSHHNPDVLYTGTTRVYKNARGHNVDWQPISDILIDDNSNFFAKNISAIAESESDSLMLVAGTSDGQIWLTRDGGQSWNNITSGLPRRYISGLAVWGNEIFVSMTGYKDAENTPHIFGSRDFGQSWRSFQYDLPSVAINKVIVLPVDNDLIYPRIVIATDAGVFYYTGQQKWIRLGNNMPVVPVYGLGYNPVMNTIIAGTFGRSIMSFDMSQIGYGVVSAENIPKAKDIIMVKNNIIQTGQNICISKNIPDKLDIQIISSGGIFIKNVQMTQTEEFFNIGNIPPGIYFLKVSNRKNTGVVKFVVIN